MGPMTACGYLPREAVARKALHRLAKRIYAFTRRNTSRTTASSSQIYDLHGMVSCAVDRKCLGMLIPIHFAAGA